MSRTRSIAFTKMNGLGNDFVVIDARRERLAPAAEEVRALAARENAATKGCDQLLILHPPRNAGRDKGDVFMQIFNADGGEVEACGNGARAVAAYLARQGTPEPVIETLGGTLQAHVPVDKTQFTGIIMPTPRRGWKDIPLAEEMPDTSKVTLHPKLPPAFMVNVGNPHAVIFVDGGTGGLAAQYGFELEKNRLLPEGANINFAACKGDNIIELDTWERGAGLTQACGTGACATAVAAFHLGKIKNHNNEFRIEPPCARDPKLKDNSDRAGIHQDNLLEILVDYDGHSLAQQGPVAFEFDGAFEAEFETGAVS
ncbi:MAG: diaminopimelate epimerase [Parvibaculales bacterium]